MVNEYKISKGNVHTVCHSPCPDCHKTGLLENGETCVSCGGAGCRDNKSCTISGGLNCEKSDSVNL